MLTTEHYLRFERLGEVHRTDRGLRADLHGEQLRIDVVRPDVVRVAISRGGVFDESPTHAVCVDPLSADVELEVEQGDGVVRLRTSALVLSLWSDPFRIDVHRPDGTPVVQTARDADGSFGTYATLNDAFVVRRRCRQSDAIYGLGEKTGHHNRKGRDFTLWNTDVLNPDAAGEFTAQVSADDPRSDSTSTEFDPYYVSIPFFYHQAQDGTMSASFLDNGYRTAYDFTRAEEYAIHAAGGQYVEYVFAGPDMPAILEAYTWLTGRTAVPPLWSLGYHQCRWAAYSQADVERIARRHREGEIPCDALWLDIDHMDGYRVFTWDTERFPDVPGMLARLEQDGLRVVTIVDPGIKHDPGYPVYDQAVERDVLCRTEGGDHYIGQVWPGNTVFPDFATPEARAWWGELNAEHVRSGIAGIWNDMNEPATGSIDPGAMRFGRGEHSHERYHNQYGLLMAMGTTAGLLEAMPDRRTFVLSRAGFAGIQRYAANWMGDNMSRWDHLWLSMPMASGLGVSGQAFVGADVGGFFGSTDAELFLRWMQYGTLTPFCRNHSAVDNLDQYVWSFGDVVHDLAREAVRLRYRLMPYLYATFLEASRTGAPVQRPLVFDHQYDATVRDLDDQYLLGPDLLVAPVVEAGMTARQVYLPAGSWYDWHTGEAMGGGRFVVAATPMEHIPLYARGGAVIPMWDSAPRSTAGYHPQVVELHLFVPQDELDHTSRLHEDDGVTFAEADGARYETTFGVRRSGSRLRLTAVVEGEGYPEHARTAYHLVVHGSSPERVLLDGEPLDHEGRHVVLPRRAEDFVVEIDL
ncbi:TIM-barrel domain-containing protein [Actinotalea sp. K2]|uniref:glycoside hydrolase family 31 protein n=1 Tax=Actinotalea sp. K2 TaxID=2939438 RepID=UPI002016D17D|nr:TIM-barrel domain-containing protein [Actinotalea sp. K2]MCL3861823.1 glycoside hydrolase family 31 protein [Actinotalea sp. K2]